jgi:hypothetical protein
VLSYEDQEYHRRRAEMELENAVLAEDSGSAVAHLELARMHRARRMLLTESALSALRQEHGAPIVHADKEA